MLNEFVNGFDHITFKSFVAFFETFCVHFIASSKARECAFTSAFVMAKQGQDTAEMKKSEPDLACSLCQPEVDQRHFYLPGVFCPDVSIARRAVNQFSGLLMKQWKRTKKV